MTGGPPLRGPDQAGPEPQGPPEGSLRHLPELVAALGARDLERVLARLGDDVRLEVDALGPPAVGKAAVADRLQLVLDRTSDSRFIVRTSVQGADRARQDITVAARPLPPGAGGWVVAMGSVTWELERATGLVRLVQVAVDRDALQAQWHRSVPLPPGSFRSELALASFDPDEVVETRVTVMTEPPPRRRRRRLGPVVAAAALLTAALVTGGLLLTGGGSGLSAALPGGAGWVGREAAPTPGADTGADPVTSVAGTAAATGEPGTPTAPDPTATDPTATDPTATDPTVTDSTASDPTAPDPTAADPTAASDAPPALGEPGLRPAAGVEVVQEDDGTQVLSLSDRVLFDPGSATLSDEAGAVLGGVADRLVGAEGELVVVGHTDDVGTAEANDRLAAARAEAVAGVITGRLGPGPVSIVTLARGDREPVAGNDTADGRAANRRVELRFTPAP